MIGDHLHELITARREKREAEERAERAELAAKKGRRPAPEPPRPEGVTLYRCQALIGGIDPAVDEPVDETAVFQIGCGATAEAKPYAAKPRCHGQPMAIAGYDWTRDVEA